MPVTVTKSWAQTSKRQLTSSPVDFIVCWTPYGEVTGGTGQALRIAKANEIAIYNFGVGPNKHFIVEDELKQHVDELGIAEAQDEFDKTNGPSWV
jgi:hypothetical protein